MTMILSESVSRFCCGSPKGTYSEHSSQGAMAESALHRSMKAIVKKELVSERYVVVEEAQLPPFPRASWSSYRPDLLGYRSESEREELVLVECETHPNMRRLGAKRSGSVSFQPFLFRDGLVRRILAVPQGRLRDVDMRI